MPWSRFHWRIVIGLGAVWILDGLEVTNVGSVASRLTEHGSGIAISVGQVGWAASFYVLGACLGALFFGQLTDRFGRKKLFMVTLAVYVTATALTAVSTNWEMFWVFRFLTGAGIGGEYSAINSAIDELIPARARGGVDLIINGTYWAGSAAAAGLSLFFLDTSIFAANVGWRLAFGLGVLLGGLILIVRRNVPESPRWLFIHGRIEEAERLVDGIESEVEEETSQPLPPAERSLEVTPRDAIPFSWIGRTAVRRYPRRSVLALALFVGQAFLYNGITFNLGTLMTGFFGVASGDVPIFIALYAVGNLLGPLTLGRLFDTVGRRPMITGTYLGSAALGVVLAVLFWGGGTLNSWSFIILVMATFFLASAGASAAYLTASEIFPMETRALAIAFFYAVGTAIGGIAGPALFGSLIASMSHAQVAIGFLVGSGVMALGGVAEIFFGISAEGRSLEDIAQPLTAAEGPDGGGEAEAAHGGGSKEPVVLDHAAASARYRRQAAEARARAAEWRAEEHRHRAEARASGTSEAEERADVEMSMAELSDRVAEAHEELATYHDLEGEAEAAPDEAEAATAHQRARAAENRAWSHEQEAQALSSIAEDESDRHRVQAEVMLERARAEEQRALASEARASAEREEDEGRRQIGRRRAAMHDQWAAMHDERALAHEHRAAGRHELAERTWSGSEIMAEEARAAAFRAEAAEHQVEAEAQETTASATGERARLVREEADGRAERARRERDVEARVRARLERQAASRSGLRRYRPGPAHFPSLPAFGAPPPLPEEALDREIVALETALADHGPMERRELARVVGARYWGPGVFNEAVRQALAEGGIRRLSRNWFGPASEEERRTAS